MGLGETAVFRIVTTGALLHALDDAFLRVFSGSARGEPLTELVSELSPTPILFIAGGRGASGPGGGEYGLAQMYSDAAREPDEFWGLPEGRHTAAIRERPEEYERRVVGFFDHALLEGSNE